MNKNTIIFLWALIILISCSSKGNQNTFVTKKAMDEVDGKADSVFLIRLSDDVLIHWDNRSQSIVNDTLFNSITASFSEKRQNIINQISDTTETSAKACSAERNLVIGDIAFLLIDKIKRIPYFQALGVQWDAFGSDCKYPEGMFDYINNYREEVKSKIESYLALKN